MYMSVAEKIRTLMVRQNVSMGELAERTGQSRQNLSNKMKRGNFTEKELITLAEALGYSVNVQFINQQGSVEL